MADRVGQQFGSYRLVRLLGQGGFAEVYLGEHLRLATHAAIKILHTHVVDEDVETFQQEARTIAQLAHPHIVKVFDFALQDGTPFLVMQYAPNGTLRQRYPRGTRLPLKTILPYVKQVADGLQYAHEQKLVHRDIKPENMLLGPNDEVLLSDFGIATIAQTSRSQGAGEVAGTVGYMAPEQIHGKPRPASDQYSLGIVVYEWLTGAHPFQGSFMEIATQQVMTPPPSLCEQLPTLSPLVDQVVLTALAKDPKDRFASVQAFALALEQASLAEPTTYSASTVANATLPTASTAQPFHSGPTLLASTPPGPAPIVQPPGTLSDTPTFVTPMPPSAQSSVPSGVSLDAPTFVTPIPPAPGYSGWSPPAGAAPGTWPGSAPGPTPPAWQAPGTWPGSPPDSTPPAPLPARPGRKLSSRAALIAIGSVIALVVVLGAIFSVPRLGGSPSSTVQPTATAGIKTGFGVIGKTINLGILTALTGAAADSIGKPLARGIEVFFDAINANGGIDGYKINLIEKDDMYPDTATQVQQYEAIHNQVLMIAESLGTPTTFAIKDLATADNMLVSAANPSSELISVPNFILPGTPYRLEVENAFDYVVNQLHVQNPKTGMLYENDDYGLEGLTGYQEAVRAYNLDDVGQFPFRLGQQDISSQVLQLKANGARYVFLTSTPADTATIILTAHRLGYDPQWILQSPAYLPLLLNVQDLGDLLSKEAWVVGQGATWGDTSQPGMAQMLSDIQKYAPNQKPDHYFEMGYIEAKIDYAILKKAADNRNLTRQGLVSAFHSLKNVYLGGLIPNVSYGIVPNNRVPTRDSVIFAVDPTVPTTLKPLSVDFVGTAAASANFQL